MQIKNIKISNILNYDYVENLNQVDGISFNTKEKWVTNIVIGPNWSGKSNLLEIINQIYKVGLQKDYVYDKNLNKKLQAEIKREKIEKGHYNQKKYTKQLQQVIWDYATKTQNLTKHKDYKEKPSKVVMTILLHKGDFDNMRFLNKNRNVINKLIKKYSTIDFQFGEINTKFLTLENKLNLYFTFDEKQEKFFLRTKKFTDIQHYILDYIQNIELLQICMHLYNKYEKKDDKPWWYSLKNTFAILWPNRSYGQIKNKTYHPNMSSYELNKIIKEQDTKRRSEWPLWYYLCKRKIKELTYYNTNYQNQFIQSINNILQPYFGFQLIVQSWLDRNIRFFFLSNHDHLYHIDELSSGLQSIILIVLAMFWHDLHHGLCIIDEPELHLHPQLQKSLIEALHHIQEQLSVQCIVATHSPLFIDEKNIHNVIRLSTENNGIAIKTPKTNISQDEANMIHMLKYEHMTKIFFVPKIIMVEGETDAYFLNYYIDYLEKNKLLQAGEFEILTIGGKGRFKIRKKFLTKFWIQSYYIGDWDNILDTIPVKNMREYKKLMYSDQNEEYHLEHKTQFYKILINIIHDKDPILYERMNRMIKKYYQDQIYLFAQWDLETYLGLHRKWLEETINFCNKHFEKWLHEEAFSTYRQEINKILGIIFQQSL